MEVLLVLVNVIADSELDRHPALLTQMHSRSCECGTVQTFSELLHTKCGAAEVLGKRTVIVTLYQEEGIVGIAHELAYRTRFHGDLLIVKEH